MIIWKIAENEIGLLKGICASIQSINAQHMCSRID